MLVLLALIPHAWGLDSDGDGLDDADEVLAHLPPFVADSDGDGRFDHLDPDMDGDGVPNVDECRLGGVSGLALVNGGFEEPDYVGTGVRYPATMPGWSTTDSSFEVWLHGFEGKNAYEGDQFVEMNAFAVGTLYQDVVTTPGDVYVYAFSHRGRFGSDTISFNLGDPASPLTTIRTVTDGPGGWGRWGGVITVSSALTRFAYQSVASACGLSCGNLLDDISFTPACDLDSDADGTVDALDTDADEDGVLDGVDVCPGLDDATEDPDGDLLCGAADLCPLDPLNDYDADGYCGDVDLCSGFNDADDLDADGIPDGCDSDRDGDGYGEEADCNESDPTVGAPLLWYRDMDGDGYGDVSTEFSTCAPGVIWVTDKHDCDDTDAALNPAATETCFDLVDLNCDGSISYDDADEDGVCGPVDVCPLDAANDADGDGLCESIDLCPLDTANDGDGDGLCDSDDLCPRDVANDVDGDLVCGDLDRCPGFDDYADADEDGLADGCDACPTDALNDADGDEACAGDDTCAGYDDREDADADLVPDGCDACPEVASEEPDDLDEDGTPDACDSDVDGDTVDAGEDCDDLDALVLDAGLWFLDHDRDGYGDAEYLALACDVPAYFVADGSDCDDGMARVHPGAAETCTDELDVNCDGLLSFDDPDYDGACSDVDPCPSRYGFVCGPPPVDSGTATGTYWETDTGTGTATTTATATATATDTATGTPTATATETSTGTPTATATATSTATSTQACEESDPEVVTVYVDEEDPEVYAGGWSCDVTASDGMEIVAVLLGMLGVYITVRRPRDEQEPRDD